MRIPPTGLDKDTLFQRLEAYRADDLDTHSGRVWAYLYDAGRDVFEVGQRAYAMYLKENGLDPTAFRSLLRFEREIVDMARAHLNGPEWGRGHLHERGDREHPAGGEGGAGARAGAGDVGGGRA